MPWFLAIEGPPLVNDIGFPAKELRFCVGKDCRLASKNYMPAHTPPSNARLAEDAIRYGAASRQSGYCVVEERGRKPPMALV